MVAPRKLIIATRIGIQNQSTKLDLTIPSITVTENNTVTSFLDDEFLTLPLDARIKF